MNAEEIKRLINQSANEDWSFAELASAISHSPECAKSLTLDHFCGMPLKCKCGKEIPS